ncbi:MAG TPA: nuclear transport factor 2 family protein [Bryobacteraceae bacterium]|jgi:ketosteroid isomerase-like protein|nr:nuclear transport factor 2 family protein [Bryobacteraceae bacterium]
MRKLRNLFPFVLLAACAFAGQPTPAVEKAIAAAEKEWTQAVLKNDQAALDKILADDLLYTHSAAKTETKADFLAALKTTTYQAIDFTAVKIRQFGQTAVVTHNAMIKTVQTGVANLYITHVWVRQNGRWQLASRQATRLP